MLGNDCQHYLGGLEIKFPKELLKSTYRILVGGRGSGRLGLPFALSKALRWGVVESLEESHSACFKGLSVGKEI